MQPELKRETTDDGRRDDALATCGDAPAAPRDEIHESTTPEAMAKAQIAASVRGLSKSFKQTKVLEDIDFDVSEGESLVLLGASGSG